MQQYRKNLGKVSLTAEGAWNRNKEYEILSIVYDENTNHAFVSRKDIPKGVDLYNKKYWMPFNVSGYADNNIILLSQKTSESSIESYTLEEAIKTVASVGRRPGAILGFYNENADRLDIGGRWEIWQYNGTDTADWENVNNWNNIYYNYNKFMGWFKDENFLNKYAPFPEIGCYAFVGGEFNEAILYRCDEKYIWINTGKRAWNYIKVIGDVNIENAPDYEDLTEAQDGTIKFADKAYNKSSFSGLGRIYLRKNIVNGKNILTQDIMGKENTRYIIQYDYDLDGSTLSIPEGSVLDFQGGSFKNGTIIGNNAIIVNGDYQIFGNGITIDGTWVNPFTLEQFGANTNSEDNRESIERFNFSKVSKVNLLGIYRTSIGINIVCNEGEEKDVVIYSNSNGGIVHSIDRWGSVSQQYAVHVTRAKSVRINGINIEKEVRYKELVDNTYSVTNSYCIVIEQSAQGSINVNDTDGIWVENCRLIDNCGVPNTVNGKSFYGMIWIGNYFGKCKNISVCNNIIEKPHGRIVYMSESSEINISQNKIIGVDHNYNSNTCSDLTTIVFRILSCKNIDVHDNYISYNTDYSVSDFVSRVFHISANDLAFAPSENCNVSNNIVDVKSSAHEIRLCTSEACLRLNIKSNKFILGDGIVRIVYFNNTLDWSNITAVIFESNEIYNYNNHMFMCAGSWIPMTLRNNNFYNDDSSLSSNYVNIINYSESTDSNKIINEGSRLFLSGSFVKIMSINNAQRKNDFSETPDYLTNVSTLVKSKGLTGVSGIKGRVCGLRVVGARYLPVAKGEAGLYECFNGIGERIIDSSMNISDIVAIMQEQPCVTVCGNIDLNGKTVNLKANGNLRIIFGTISNGVIIGNNTRVIVNGPLSAGITATKQGVWIWENNKFKVGNTSYRPSLDSSDKGFSFFDTELSKPIWWAGDKWVDATGVMV